MPELPEVETVRMYLEPQLKGKKIKQVDIFYEPLIKNISIEVFKHRLEGQVLDCVGRYGKFLLFYFSEVVLVSHLRMEGKYSIKKKETPLEKHEHVVFIFSDDEQLRYKDVRKFGTFHLFTRGEEFKNKPLMNLGLEPFAEQFTPEYMMENCNSLKRNVKSILLDQTKVAGLGNIYVDEVLFCAKIHPERSGSKLSLQDWNNVTKCSQQILTNALIAGGSTIRNYTNAKGESGSFQNALRVYGRGGEPCFNCSSTLQKEKISGRGTVFCPTCQN